MSCMSCATLQAGEVDEVLILDGAVAQAGLFPLLVGGAFGLTLEVQQQPLVADAAGGQQELHVAVPLGVEDGHRVVPLAHEADQVLKLAVGLALAGRALGQGAQGERVGQVEDGRADGAEEVQAQVGLAHGPVALAVNVSGRHHGGLGLGQLARHAVGGAEQEAVYLVVLRVAQAEDLEEALHVAEEIPVGIHPHHRLGLGVQVRGQHAGGGNGVGQGHLRHVGLQAQLDGEAEDAGHLAVLPHVRPAARAARGCRPSA